MSLVDLVGGSYNFRARLQPALIVIMPVIIVGFIIYPELETIATKVASVFAFFGGAIWLTQLSRDRGRRIEPRLFREWGGCPSVGMLRWRDDRINSMTKERYHLFLEKNVPQFRKISHEYEANVPEVADKMYQTAIDWLLSRTRDTKKFHLIFEENMNYGSRRNLYALKPIALYMDLILCFLLLAMVDEWNNIFASGYIQSLTESDIRVFAAFAVVALHALAMMVVATKVRVKAVSDAYARQLLAACDMLEAGESG